jgi:hypothetical protein
MFGFFLQNKKTKLLFFSTQSKCTRKEFVYKSGKSANSTFRRKKKQNNLSSFASQSIYLHFPPFGFVTTSLKLMFVFFAFSTICHFVGQPGFLFQKKLIFLSDLCFKEFYQKHKN